MTTDYKVRVYDRTGTLKYEPDNWRRFSFTRTVNAAGALAIAFPTSAPLVDAVALDWRFEVWRRDVGNGLAWRCEFEGLVRDVERYADDRGERETSIICPGVLSLLGRRIVAYKAGTANRSTFSAQKAETIAKSLVRRNATSNGTTGDGRMRDVDETRISVAADAATGATLDYNCAWQNLLSALQEVAQLGGGDYDLVRTGAAAWEFRWYNGQRGTDRSATVRFGLDYGNVTLPRVTWGTLTEATVAIVGGQGEAAARSVVVRNGANYLATYHGVETFVEAMQYSTTGGLNTAGDAALYAAQARRETSFEVVQTPASFYGVHYDFGDLVTVIIEGYTAVKQVASASITVDEYGERLTIGTVDK
ncbi:MAG: hypothetical protein NAOJABEB_03152 [Steroidobacteraceae bacterium]|nr:hypothetical protein [Steroidobacteraceae bacterium]